MTVQHSPCTWQVNFFNHWNPSYTSTSRSTSFLNWLSSMAWTLAKHFPASGLTPSRHLEEANSHLSLGSNTVQKKNIMNHCQEDKGETCEVLWIPSDPCTCNTYQGTDRFMEREAHAAAEQGKHQLLTLLWRPKSRYILIQNKGVSFLPLINHANKKTILVKMPHFPLVRGRFCLIALLYLGK